MSLPSVEILRPVDSAELELLIGDALANRSSLEIMGAGSKRPLGQTMAVDKIVSLSQLTGITLYEPDELVLSARAGTPLAEIEAALAEHNQQLSFEPPDWGALLGSDVPQTIGGVVGANLAGPRRIQAGGARDHVLGVSMVTGRGEVVKTGGRVVKNVTGYDLCKLITGSYGTLAVATDIIFKVLPAGEKIRTILVVGLDEIVAVKAMTEALSSPYDVSAASFLPGNLTGRSKVSYISGASASITAIRVEGPAPSVEARCSALRTKLGVHGDVEELHFHNSRKFWQEIGNVTPFAEDGGQVWRVSVPPSAAAKVIQTIRDGGDAEFYLDWGGGLIWTRLPNEVDDGSATLIREAIKSCGGHATLIRASTEIRSRVAVFQPQANGVAVLSRRVKQGFDPANILNPGRMALMAGGSLDAD
jgi:glycolate oxidase FAD binding subunit